MERNSITDSFDQLARLLAGATEPWCVFGGAAMLLHGLVPDRFKDIDVLIGRRDAARLVRTAAVERIDDGGTHRFRSEYYMRVPDSPIAIELMSGLHVRVGTEWIEIEPRRLVRRRLGEALLFVPDAVELARIFRLCGRDRDLDRAQRLTTLAKAPKAAPRTQADEAADGPPEAPEADAQDLDALGNFGGIKSGN